uniref:Uncharacterized protein n=1 Tax=Alexandrium andersonii TaxID=327968 RepID=A0A7S2DBA1_9DINO|mmetsp:Transcript_50556/g.114524  ORF Transcript_50556/g.114524 Transcript_50556/m.114524 type:complete len:247 (+) Transcript_50556:1-741(+)
MKCSLSRKKQVQCTMIRSPVELKEPYTFLDEAVIGDTPEADFCPYFHTPISNHVCTDEHASTFPISNVNFMREVFGADSRCLDSTLHADVRVSAGVYKAEPKYFTEAQPGCFKIVCGDAGASYDVMISNLHGSVVKLGTCTREDQALTLVGLQGQVTCAAPEELCSEGLGTPRHTQFDQLSEDIGPVMDNFLAVEKEQPQRWRSYMGGVALAGCASVLLLVRRFGHAGQVRAAGFGLIGPMEHLQS